MSVTVGWLIEQLQTIADQHGGETEVYVHDADTDWPLAIDPETAVRFGLNEFGEGREGCVMIQSGGYHYTPREARG